MLHDYQATQFYHGLNREDSFYETEKNMRRSERRRVKKWPTVTEFWDMEEPQTFRLIAGAMADWRTFRRWFNKHLRSIDGSDFDFDKAALGKYAD